MFNEYDFEIEIGGCLLTDYVATTKVTEIRYQLNSPTLTDGYYQFDEVPVCGYPEVVTFTNYAPVASFMTHNVATSDFTIA